MKKKVGENRKRNKVKRIRFSSRWEKKWLLPVVLTLRIIGRERWKNLYPVIANVSNWIIFCKRLSFKEKKRVVGGDIKMKNCFFMFLKSISHWCSNISNFESRVAASLRRSSRYWSRTTWKVCEELRKRDKSKNKCRRGGTFGLSIWTERSRKKSEIVNFSSLFPKKKCGSCLLDSFEYFCHDQENVVWHWEQ